MEGVRHSSSEQHLAYQAVLGLPEYTTPTVTVGTGDPASAH